MHDVAGERNTGLSPHEMPDELRAAGSFRTDVDLSGVPEHRSAEPVWREIGVYVQLGKAFDITVGDREQVTQRDLDSQRPSQRAPRLLDGVENIPGRTVARGMQVQIDAVAVQLLHEAAQSLRREQHAAVVVGVRDVGLQHAGGQNILHAIVVDLDGVELQFAVAVPFPQPEQDSAAMSI